MACFVSLWRPLRQLSVTIAAVGSWRRGDDLEAAALLDEQTLEQVISPSWVLLCWACQSPLLIRMQRMHPAKFPAVLELQPPRALLAKLG
jgi:hypothetical protein